MSQRINSKGQVTIPKALRNELGLAPGQDVDFARAADGAVLLRLSPVNAGRLVENQQKNQDSLAEARERGIAEYMQRIEKLRGTLKGGPSTDEIMALTRGDD